MKSGSRTGGIIARAGVTALTFAVLTVMVVVAAPLSLEAPYLGILLTGSDSALMVVGSFVIALLLVGALARVLLRSVLTRWPEWEPSFRLGAVFVPVVALGCLLVPEAVNEHLALLAMLSLPTVLAVSLGAASGWLVRSGPQDSVSSMPSPLSNEPVR